MGKTNESFLDSIISQVVEKGPESLRQTCFIFPTRRACLIFRNKLAATTNKPIWAPGVLSIRDFVEASSGIRLADEKELLFLLFRINRKYWPGQNFTRFHAWGQMLLNDFDEIDKQLDQPDDLFTGIREIRQLERHFNTDTEAYQWITQFTGSIDPGNLSKLQERFAENWDRLIHIYKEFRTLLSKEGIGYEGLAYKSLIEKLNSGTFQSHWNHFVFSGFYGMSAVEESMIRELKTHYKVSLEWDADQYYTTVIKNHEAGNYFRNSQLFSGTALANHFSDTKKKITVTGVSLQTGQAKYAGQLLQELSESGQLDVNNTAVILPDEGILFPALYSIPNSIHPVNVTMGLPLRNTVFADLTNAFGELFNGAKLKGNGEVVFYHGSWEAVCNNPLGMLLTGKVTATGFTAWPGASDIERLNGKAAADLIRVPPSTATQTAAFMKNVFMTISQKEGTGKMNFEQEVCAFIAAELQELEVLLDKYQLELTASDGWQVVTETISGLKLPFSGEPVKGLQVMGFLETRALDFETVIILSCNENLLPRSSSGKSFIPFSLRRAFGLSSFIEQDASSAYHFYRLLHKARQVYLVYDTEIRGISGSEPSRFILQLEQELRKHMGNNLDWHHQVVHVPLEIAEDIPVIIQKTGAIAEALSLYTGDVPKRKFSSSSLSTYISCSLRFYYSYIAKIREKEDANETIEANVFGNILHTSLEQLYAPLSGKEVQVSDIDQLIAESGHAVSQAIRKEFGSDEEQLEGNDRILAGALHELVRRILKNDRKEAPFVLKGLEQEFETVLETPMGRVMLLGRFDRIDSKEGTTRIIDYKTGKVETKPIKNLEKIFQDPGTKTLFQLFLYDLVYNTHFPAEKIRPGFYVAQNLSEGIRYADQVNEQNRSWFRESISKLISGILDPAIPFEKTPDLKQCEYCPYKDICHR